MTPQVREGDHVADHIGDDGRGRDGLQRHIQPLLVGPGRPQRDRHLGRHGDKVDDREDPHAPDGAEDLVQVGVHPVERQRHGHDSQIARDLPDGIGGERADMVQRHERCGEHHEVKRHGDHEKENLPRAVDDAGDDAASIPVGLHVRQLREQRRGHGHREERVREREPQPRVGDDRRAVVGEHVGGGVLGGHRGKRAHGDEHRRRAEAQRVGQRRVVPIDTRPQTDAHLLQGRNLEGHLHEDAERIANGDGEEGQILVGLGDDGIQDERGDDDEVVEHRRKGGPEVLAVRVQKA